jgi:peptidoglycan hydrolase-like protein with peptidoglycan-binding domain
MLKERLNSFFSKDKFETNLYYGVRGEEIRRLQQFLSDQGEEIYPEKLVTGNFLSLTRQAVVRFQEKYKDEILTPLGLEKGTGYFGPSTRQKVNELLGY